ncbi:MAG: DUF58 domain-containing protein [Xanthomonadaceae bacterium]|jgi:uncharacterized protein (DUF58 family)|nr:DUF58 domain-containing protein [Xanthomonadaceae bacterium]
MLDQARQRLRQRVLQWTRPREPESFPVTLDRHRVYVIPTPFGYFLAVLFLTMFIGALNYNNNPAFLLVLILGASSLASLIVTHLQLSGLRIDAISAEPVPAGSPLSLRIALNSQDGRPRRGLRIDYGDIHTFCSLQQSAACEAIVEIPTTQRGWLSLQRISLSSVQPLGLARGQSWIWPAQELLVYPRSESPGPPLPESGGSIGKSRIHPLGEDLHQLRAYRAGDPIRAIAWKHSARQDTLLIREYEQNQGVEVVLDWENTSSLPYERRIARLAHWVDEAERMGQRYRLLLPGHPPLGPGHGLVHRHACLKALALLPHDTAR